ncbi:phosphatase PAP2 family protein [Streptomyces sp. NPDC058001]|uniref:phosphatase PAP2 family protein n=1 Tax=Streptomyces sp. NPDC058001 TaxID=3346300 RepID=UPI0036E6297C
MRATRAALGLALLSAVLLLLVALRWSPLMDADGSLAREGHRWAVSERGVTHVNRVLTDWVWDPWTMRALVAAATLWLLSRKAWWLALWITVTCVLGTVLQQSLKAALDRDRPVWPDPVDSAHYAAFPSGHAMTATVVCGLLLWVLHLYGAGRVLWRTAVAVAAVSVAGVGLTRLWLGVHWPSDVLGGWLLGALMVTLAIASYSKVRGSART